MGCDQYRAGAVTGAVSVSISAPTNVAPGFPAPLVANISGRLAGSSWDFGDGQQATNQPLIAHAWATNGDYLIVMRAWNETYPSGMTATSTVHVTQPVHYVSLTSTSPVAAYTSWDTAATNIQDAVDAATVPGALVLVSNGVYQTGGCLVYGSLTNRLAITKPLRVDSVNGPAFTAIVGSQVAGTTNGDAAVRCVLLTNGAVLSGFTLTNGATRSMGNFGKEQSGGGVWCASMNAVLTNCILAGNTAGDSGGGVCSGTLYKCALQGNLARNFGGGACSSTLDKCILTANSSSYGGGGAGVSMTNCVVAGNSATNTGGGVYGGSLLNCTVTGNSAASQDSGSSAATLVNCIVYYNNPPGSDYNSFDHLTNCCTTLPPLVGVGNFTNAPRLADLMAGDLHLQSNSPCINAGNSAYPAGLQDYDGLPRVSGGTVDVGAFEFQNPSSSISYAWLQQYAFPMDGSVDFADPDGDSMNNWQEWKAGTDPTDPSSLLSLSKISRTGLRSMLLTWTSVTNRNYFVQRATNLAAPASFTLLQTNLPGGNGTISWTDTNAPMPGPAFYRVGVQ